MPIYKPPSLVRQNAFMLEDDQTVSPLDRVCSICYKTTANDDDELFKPCQCQSPTHSTLYAHRECFSQWLKRNGYPTHCVQCKSVYAKVPSTGISKNRRRRKYVMSIVISIIVLYSLYHLLSSCSTFETISSTKLYADFGDNTYNNVPDVLVAPRISKSCVKSSLPMHCTIPVIMISIILYFFY